MDRSGTAGSTTGCTITGLNYDTYEGVEITGSNGTGGCPSGDICFVPAYVHGATAEWGEDAVRNPANNFVHAELLNVNISQSAGAQLWAEGGSGVVLDGVTLSPRSLLTSIAADYSSGQFQGSFTQNSEMDADINFAPNCGVANTCGNTSFPAGLLCDQLPSGTGNGGGNGCPGFINNTIIDSAIYTRATSDDGDPGSGIPSMDNVTIERSNGCGVVLDSRYGAIYGAATIKILALSDPSAGGFSGGAYGSPTAYLCSTDPYSFQPQEIDLQSPSNVYGTFAVNKYWANAYTINNAAVQDTMGAQCPAWYDH